MDPLSGRRRESNPYNCKDEDPQEPFHQQQPPFALPPPPFSPSTSSARQSGEDHPGGGPSTPFVEKEHMFDKVVTPSDVGKLNRLVIPKQHAEKYFPLDAAAGENGLLLSFEDRTGKHWRFRYSYWNSSQSYVMTKGWSRFVKEKHLDAGDTVSFGRGVGEAGRHRLFIDWKHRPGALPLQYPLLHRLPLTFHGDPSPVAVPFARAGAAVPWGRLVVPPPPSSLVSAMAAYDRHLYYGHNPGPVPSNPYLHLRSAGNPSSQVAVQLGIGSGGGDGALGRPIFEPVSAAQGGETVGRTVRLFGVNLGCSPSAADTGGDAAAAHGNVQPPALPLPHMRPGAPEVEESPGRDQQPASMDMAM